MEIPHIEMDPISEHKQRTSISPIKGFAPREQEGHAPGTGDRQRDVFIMDSARQNLRNLCESGKAQSYLNEIIESGIEPDCLRAELAFRVFSNDSVATPIILSYLAGNFKEALSLTDQLEEDGNAKKLAELLIFADYFAGRFDKGCDASKNLEALNFSPFLCYAYADMLLSLGYVDEARTYTKKYITYARKYLRNFVSEKEKYDDEKKRREQGSRRGKYDGNADKRRGESQPLLKEVMHDPTSAQSPALYGELKDMLERRKVLLDILKVRNVSIDKRPLMFELEDIDAQIAQKTGKYGVVNPLL
jgi:hypothetical protein